MVLRVFRGFAGMLDGIQIPAGFLDPFADPQGRFRHIDPVGSEVVSILVVDQAGLFHLGTLFDYIAGIS